MTTTNLLDYVPPSDMNTITYRGSQNEEEQENERVAQLAEQANFMHLNNVQVGNINPLLMYQNGFIPNQQALQNSMNPMIMLPTLQPFHARQGVMGQTSQNPQLVAMAGMQNLGTPPADLTTADPKEKTKQQTPTNPQIHTPNQVNTTHLSSGQHPPQIQPNQQQPMIISPTGFVPNQFQFFPNPQLLQQQQQQMIQIRNQQLMQQYMGELQAKNSMGAQATPTATTTSPNANKMALKIQNAIQNPPSIANNKSDAARISGENMNTTNSSTTQQAATGLEKTAKLPNTPISQNKQNLQAQQQAQQQVPIIEEKLDNKKKLKQMQQIVAASNGQFNQQNVIPNAHQLMISPMNFMQTNVNQLQPQQNIPAHAMFNPQQQPKSSPSICRFFINNQCRFGLNCRFSHNVHPSPQANLQLIPNQIFPATTSQQQHNINAAATINPQQLFQQQFLLQQQLQQQAFAHAQQQFFNNNNNNNNHSNRMNNFNKNHSNRVNNSNKNRSNLNRTNPSSSVRHNHHHNNKNSYKQQHHHHNNNSNSNNKNNKKSKGMDKKMCKFFVRGNCKYGELCYFSHQQETSSTTSSQSSENDKGVATNVTVKSNQGKVTKRA